MLFTVMLNPLCVSEIFLLLIENTLFRCEACSSLSPPASPSRRNISQPFQKALCGLKRGNLG